MSKRDKLIQKILDGKPVTYAEAENILIYFGYNPRPPRSGSSHVTFEKSETKGITLVRTQNPLKPYLMKELKEAIQNEQRH